MSYKSSQGAWFLASLSVVHLCRRLMPAHEFSKSSCAKCEGGLNQPCIVVKDVRCHVCNREKTVVFYGLGSRLIVCVFKLYGISFMSIKQASKQNKTKS